VANLLDYDYFMVAADFAAYSDALGKADAVWRASDHAWTKKAVHNTARLGWFSADRTIRDYAREIWSIPVA
jgi:starch phosphorylase